MAWPLLRRPRANCNVHQVGRMRTSTTQMETPHVHRRAPLQVATLRSRSASKKPRWGHSMLESGSGRVRKRRPKRRVTRLLRRARCATPGRTGTPRVPDADRKAG